MISIDHWLKLILKKVRICYFSGLDNIEDLTTCSPVCHNAKTRQQIELFSWQKSVHAWFTSVQKRDISCLHQHTDFWCSVALCFWEMVIFRQSLSSTRTRKKCKMANISFPLLLSIFNLDRGQPNQENQMRINTIQESRESTRINTIPESRESTRINTILESRIKRINT